MLAKECVKEVDGIEEIYIRLLSQIGQPIDQPLVASIQVLPKEDVGISQMNCDIESVIDSGLADITCITEKIIRGEVRTF